VIGLHVETELLAYLDEELDQRQRAQVEAHLKTRSLAEEMERMCRLGRLAPDVWMEQAVGEPISSAALIGAADEALTRMGP
jgi:anti-sigma factor RsiW